MSGSNKDNKISTAEFMERLEKIYGKDKVSKENLEEICGKGNVSTENIETKLKLNKQLKSVATKPELRMDPKNKKKSNLSPKEVWKKTKKKLKNSRAYKNLKDVINRRKIERQDTIKLKKLDTKVSVEMHPSSKLQLTEDVLGFAERIKEIDDVPNQYSEIPVMLPTPAIRWNKNLKSLYKNDKKFLEGCWALCKEMVEKVSNDVKNVYTTLRSLLKPYEIQRLNGNSLSNLAEKLYTSEFLLALKNNYKTAIKLTLDTYFTGPKLKKFYYEYEKIKLSMTAPSSIPEYIEGKPPGANKIVKYSTSEWPKTGETPLTYINRMGDRLKKSSFSSSYGMLLVSVLGPYTTLQEMFLDWINSLVEEFKKVNIDVSIKDLMS